MSGAPQQSHQPTQFSDLDAERYVLAACIVWPEDYLNPSRKLLTDHRPWTHELHEPLWRTFMDIQDAGIPLLSAEILKRTGRAETFSPYIDSLVAGCVTGADCEYYCKRLIELEKRRKVSEKARALTQAAGTGQVNGELDELQAAVTSLTDADDAKRLFTAESSQAIFDRTGDEVEWILDPILARGSILQLQGNPKGGKSAFALYVANSCAIGRWMAGRFSFVGDPRKVLYLSYEDSPRRLKVRSRAYLDGMGYYGNFADNLLLFERPPLLNLSSPDGWRALEKMVVANTPDILVIDTLSWVVEGDENSKADMQPALAALRRVADQYKLGIIVIHHTRKTGQTGDQASISERGRGSSAIAAAADSILDWGGRVSPNHTLCRFVSKDTGDDEFVAAYQPQEDGSIKWVMEEVVEREDAMEVKASIINILTQAKELGTTEMTAAKIHEMMKGVAALNTVRDRANQLVDQGKLVVTRGPARAKIYSLK